MINLKEALSELNIKCSGVIHVGGHKAQEYQEYKDAGLAHQVWIEANPHFFYEIKNVIKDDENCLALNYAVFDEEKEIQFGLANNGASSSILPLKEHLKSLGSLLNNFKFVQSEVNLEELYEGCCLIDELDEYLKGYGFERKITKLWDDGAVGWGDALYIKHD